MRAAMRARGRSISIAAGVVAIAAVAVAGCGGSSSAAPDTARALAPVTTPVPASAQPELTRYRASVGRAVTVLNAFGAILARSAGKADQPARLKAALVRFGSELARVRGLSLTDAGVQARRSAFVGAAEATMTTLGAYVDDLARNDLAAASSLGDRIRSVMRDIAVAAGA